MDSARRESDSDRGPLVRSPKFWLGVVVVAAIASFFVLRAVLGPKESDSEQIVAALDASIEASKEGKPGGVLDKLSSAFQVNDQSIPTDKIIAFVKKLRPDITVEEPKPIVTGDDATIISTVRIEGSLLGMHQAADLRDVAIRFHREIAYKWVFIPVSTWRMTSIQLSPTSYGDLAPWASFLD